MLGGTRQKTKPLRVRGVTVIGNDGACAKGSAMLLPRVGGAAFLPLMVGQRICTYVARSNHFPEVGTPYILNEEFLSLVLWRKIQVKTKQLFLHQAEQCSSC